MFGGFSFKDFTKEDRKAIAEKNRAIKETTENTAETLRACIESDTFRKYREELEQTNAALMEIGIDILKNVKDSKERVFLYDVIFARADILGLLLKRVNSEK